MPQNNPRPGEKYRHFKGNLYQIIARAKEESTGNPMVVYQALYGDFSVYVRPLEEFVSGVDYDKYPEATARYRFTYAPLADEKMAREAIADIPSPQLQTKDEQLNRDSEVTEKGISDLMIEFLDEDDFDKKQEILSVMASRNDLTDAIVDNLAAAMDVVIDDGDISDRMRQLRNCVRTRAKYESTRLR